MQGLLFLLLSLGASSSALAVVSSFSTSSSQPARRQVQARQYYPDPIEGTPTPEQCLTISFSEPSWAIYDPALRSVNASSGGHTGDIRFLTVNAATGLQAACRADNIEFQPTGDELNVWHDCDVPGLQFQFLLDLFQVKLRGTWQCNSTNSSSSSDLVFSANGVWNEPVVQGCLDDWNTPRGQETLCIMGGSYVPGALTSPIAIHPQWPLLPFTPTERSERCVYRSYDPEWQLNSLSYHATSGGEKYEVTLDIINFSSNEQSVCTVSVHAQDLPDNGSTPFFSCVTASGKTALLVQFDKTYSVLGIKQTWTCADAIEGIELPDYSGTAYTQLPALVCGEGREFNCTLPVDGPITFTGYSDDVVPNFPHTYYKNSCTINSMVNTKTITLKNYDVELEQGAGKGVGNFSLYNPGSGDTYDLENIPIVADGSWQACGAGSEKLPWQLVSCTYSLENKQNGLLKFELGWYCDDRDPSNAVLFKAIAMSNIGQAQGKDVALPVKSLTWEAGHGIMDRGPTLPWV
ncbi:hypothetical protein QBC35DRAFT_86071 [Podospora australis]|uniref:AA1-like domain-containing protein n=1 Tax=Podospora australis TaxID=1536484 RepID=A0AAN6WLB2_9PEZI|nr:hypothetical protein QBC35DRAFT_86071 [Podospora australis]